MNKELITKKVIAKLNIKISKTEEEMDAEFDAIKENKEDLIKFLAKELTKKGFEATVDLEGSYIFLDIENKKGDKFSFSEDGLSFKQDTGFLVLYDENSKKNFEVKFELDEDYQFKSVDLTKLLPLIK
jgi:hypothetical protein